MPGPSIVPMPRPPVLRPATEILAGLGTAARGVRAWARAPRLMALGMLPGLLTAVLLGGGIVMLILNLGDIGRSLAGAVGLDSGWVGALAAATASVAVLAGAAVVAVAAFTTLTLAIGGPFFEAISRGVDDALGGLPGPAAEEPWARSLRRGVLEGLLTVGISIVVSLVLFGVGLVPVAGGAAAFVVGALIGGRLLVIELTAFPMARRGVFARRERIAVLKRCRWRAGAFGVLAYLVFLVPVGALLAMPVVVAGATLLARHALGEDGD